MQKEYPLFQIIISTITCSTTRFPHLIWWQIGRPQWSPVWNKKVVVCSCNMQKVIIYVDKCTPLGPQKSLNVLSSVRHMFIYNVWGLDKLHFFPFQKYKVNKLQMGLELPNV